LKALCTNAYEREDYTEAARRYELALGQARRTGNKWMVASTLTFLALAREELGEAVIGLLQESLSVSQEINDYDGMAMIQLGDAYLNEQDVQRAREQYSQVAEIATGTNNHPLAALAYLNLGELALEQEQWGEAEGYYEQGLKAHLRIDDPSSRVMVMRGWDWHYTCRVR
jgi:tetratricopeptide (TPR) repeat protein